MSPDPSARTTSQRRRPPSKVAAARMRKRPVMQAEPHEAFPSVPSIIDRHSSRAGGNGGAVPPSRTAGGEHADGDCASNPPAISPNAKLGRVRRGYVKAPTVLLIDVTTSAGHPGIRHPLSDRTQQIPLPAPAQRPTSHLPLPRTAAHLPRRQGSSTAVHSPTRSPRQLPVSGMPRNGWPAASPIARMVDMPSVKAAPTVASG